MPSFLAICNVVAALIRSMMFFKVILYLYKSTKNGHAWRTVVILLNVAWLSWINCKNGYVGLLVVNLLIVLKPWLFMEM